MKRRLKQLGKRGLYLSFRALQRARVNLLPLHFYSSIPDFRDLSRREDWLLPRSMYGIACAPTAEQSERLAKYAFALGPMLRTETYCEAILVNGEDGGYGEIECYVLAGFIDTERPKRVVQIGCGVSTAIMLKAADYPIQLKCVEPYPTRFLQEEAERGRIHLLQKAAQVVDLDTLTDLDSGDLLFIDSTHTVKPGSEVNWIILEVLPRLKPGVWVHFHDICFPYEYQRTFANEDLFFWGETSLLYAFLLGNPGFRIELSMSMLHYDAPDDIRRHLPVYEPRHSRHGLDAKGGRHFPSSIFLRTQELAH